MAKLYYRAEGSNRPNKKKRYLPITTRYRLLFWFSLLLHYGLMAHYYQAELKLGLKYVKALIKRHVHG